MAEKKIKLGMTVAPKKATPYDTLEEEVLKGAGEESRLRRRGHEMLEEAGVGRGARKTESRIPKAHPTPKKPQSRA